MRHGGCASEGALAAWVVDELTHPLTHMCAVCAWNVDELALPLTCLHALCVVTGISSGVRDVVAVLRSRGLVQEVGRPGMLH